MAEPPADPMLAAKQAAGRAAAALVQDGMTVGLGTGSTVHWAIVALGERRPDIRCVATSVRTETLARSVGLRLFTPDELGALDVAIDGADEVDPAGNLTKGGGGAHAREKVVAEMAAHFVVVVDESKVVDRLGPFGTPLEVLDFAPGTVAARARALGAATVVDTGQRTDNGNLLLRAHFGAIDDPASLAGALAAIPGVVEHGIFLAATVGRVIVAGTEGVRELPR